MALVQRHSQAVKVFAGWRWDGDAETAVAWRHKDKHFNLKANLYFETHVQEVDGMGMDCVLFSRKAFESVSFMDWVQNDDDYPYYDKLKEKGFEIYLDPTIICKHYYAENKYT